MSRIAMFCTGLFLVSSLSGCCLMHGYGGYPGGGYYGGGCNSGCGAYAPGGYPSAGLYGAGAPAAAFVPPTTAGYTPFYPQMAVAPMDALPTH